MSRGGERHPGTAAAIKFDAMLLNRLQRHVIKLMSRVDDIASPAHSLVEDRDASGVREETHARGETTRRQTKADSL